MAKGYTNKTEIQNYLLIDIDSSFDAQLTRWIEAAENHIDRFCNRSFEAVNGEGTPTTKYFDGDGSDSLVIDDLYSLTALSVFDVDLSLSAVAQYPANEYPKTQLRFKRDYGLTGNSRRPIYVFDEGQQNVAVTGLWGYATAVPSDITLACTKLTAAIVKENIGGGDANEIVRESIGDFSTDYQKVSDIAHALKVEELLQPYVRGKAGNHRTGGVLL